MSLVRQSRSYPENTRWQYGQVTFLTLNIPGSNNNSLTGTPDTQAEGPVKEAQAESTARNAANLAWIKVAFDGQVLLINGDSHSFTVDKPLTDYATTNAGGKAGANVIANLIRLTTFGEFQDHWVSIEVDPHDPEVFALHQHVLAANVPSYTPPS